MNAIATVLPFIIGLALAIVIEELRPNGVRRTRRSLTASLRVVELRRVTDDTKPTESVSVEPDGAGFVIGDERESRPNLYAMPTEEQVNAMVIRIKATRRTLGELAPNHPAVRALDRPELLQDLSFATVTELSHRDFGIVPNDGDDIA